MKRQTSRPTREAMGCFLMVVFGAIMCVCLMRIGVLAIGQGDRTAEVSSWPLNFVMVAAPALGIILTGFLTYGFKGAWLLLKRKQN